MGVSQREKGSGVQQGRVTSCSRVTCAEGQSRLLSRAGQELCQELGLVPALPPPLLRGSTGSPSLQGPRDGAGANCGRGKCVATTTVGVDAVTSPDHLHGY